MSNLIFYVPIFVYVCISVQGLTLPGECDSEQFYDPGSMACQNCPANVSMMASADGFGCTCEEHSVPEGLARCRPCNATAVVSDDGSACVPRRCHVSAGKIVCRKCPNDYISVTHGFDGSPLKEVLCVKCARGFKPQNNKCVKCEACICNKNEVIVRGSCLPKRYVNDRPKYVESNLHPATLLEIVKQEYSCTKSDLRSCRTLARMCVKSFYMSDAAGPCRLWLQGGLISHTGLPQLTVQTTTKDATGEEIDLASGQDFFDHEMVKKNQRFIHAKLDLHKKSFSNDVCDAMDIVLMIHTKAGGLKLIRAGQNIYPCMPPLHITVGNDIIRECHLNISKPDVNVDDIYELYLDSNGDFKPIPLSILKPSGYYVQKEAWSSGKFRKFFAFDLSLSTTANVTNVVYLKSFTLQIKVQRVPHTAGSLRATLSAVAQYATAAPLADTITATLRVTQDMPLAGVLRGLEITGGIFGALSLVYAAVQWRGAVRRGAPQASAVPLLAAAMADALYFAVLLSTVHALSAEAGTLGLALPLSRAEESVIEALIYTVLSLKIIKVLWINWCQCRCDIFFIDWSEYNPPLKEEVSPESPARWRAAWLAREWSGVQSARRAPPALTVTLTLGVLQLLSQWQSYVPKSQGYNWAVGKIAWWGSYCSVLLARWLHDKVVGSPTDVLPKVCQGVGLSLLVFQEDLYAHYVHGRYDAFPDAKSMAGPLARCRVVCAPQLRAVYKKLSTPEYGNLGNTEPNRILLSRFLAAFFERALDGLNWVGTERTVLERLVDVELSARDGGATSALLYDPDNTTPSCFAVTWWGEEWTLATFDAMVFGCVLLATGQAVLAAFTTLVTWQVMKLARTWLGNKNIRKKIQVEI